MGFFHLGRDSCVLKNEEISHKELTPVIRKRVYELYIAFKFKTKVSAEPIVQSQSVLNWVMFSSEYHVPWVWKFQCVFICASNYFSNVVCRSNISTRRNQGEHCFRFFQRTTVLIFFHQNMNYVLETIDTEIWKTHKSNSIMKICSSSGLKQWHIENMMVYISLDRTNKITNHINLHNQGISQIFHPP